MSVRSLRPIEPAVAILVALAALLTGCAAEDADTDGAQRPAPPRVTVVPVMPQPGGEVTVSAAGLPPGRAVEVGLGPAQMEYNVVARATTSVSGALEVAATLPGWAEAGRHWVAVVRLEEDDRTFVSDPVLVAEASEDVVTVSGELTDAGVECQALRGDDGDLYTLTGDLGGFGVGDRVTVRGVPAEASLCMQGRTLHVMAIDAAR